MWSAPSAPERVICSPSFISSFYYINLFRQKGGWGGEGIYIICIYLYTYILEMAGGTSNAFWLMFGVILKDKIMSYKCHKDWAEISTTCRDAGVLEDVGNFWRKGNWFAGGIYRNIVSKERARLQRNYARKLKALKSVEIPTLPSFWRECFRLVGTCWNYR